MNSTDVVVVGAGTAGIAFSVFAAKLGLTTAVVEQLPHIGGTLHRTGGMMSAAGTVRQRERGIDDRPEQHLNEVLRIAGPSVNRALVERAVLRAPAMIDWLGEEGFRFHPEAPAIYFGHPPYEIPRTYWGEEAGISILKALRPHWESGVRSGRIQPYLSHSLGEITLESARVSGVLAASLHSGDAVRIGAKSVVIASGGFGSSQEMYMRYAPSEVPPPTAALPGNQGGGHQAALRIGAAIRPAREILRLGRFPLPQDPSRVDMTLRADFEARSRPPRETWVNSLGQRFVDESDPDNQKQEHAVLEQPGKTFWAVFDSAALIGGPSLIRGWTPEDYRRAANEGRREVWCADSLETLASSSGVDPSGLLNTITEWNSRIEEGHVASAAGAWPVKHPPFFAVRCRGAILTTFSGLAADADLRILSENGDPIHGLFGIGEVLGAAALSGETWAGGMCVTPALTLGRELAYQLARGSKSGE